MATNKTIAEALSKLGLVTPAIREGSKLLRGVLNPKIQLDPQDVRKNWSSRYGIPWGARGDHSTGIGVITELARRKSNPLNLEPHPYTLTFTDQVDAAILGDSRGISAWSILRDMFGSEPIDQSGCPPGWECTPIPDEIVNGIIIGTIHFTPIRGVKEDFKGLWQMMDRTVDGKPWVRYNPFRVQDPRVSPPVTPAPPVTPPSPPITPPHDPHEDRSAILLREIEDEINLVRENMKIMIDNLKVRIREIINGV